jgi:tetrahydromethanopterin S-methyltransferase subunit G
MTAQPWEPRMARLEGAYEQVDKRLDSIDQRLETLDRKIDFLRDDLGRQIDILDKKFDGKFDRLTQVVVGTWITTMLALFGLFLHR